MFQDVGYFALYREEFDRDNLGSVEIVRGRDEGLLEIDRTWMQMTSNSYSSAKFPNRGPSKGPRLWILKVSLSSEIAQDHSLGLQFA